MGRSTPLTTRQAATPPRSKASTDPSVSTLPAAPVAEPVAVQAIVQAFEVADVGHVSDSSTQFAPSAPDSVPEEITVVAQAEPTPKAPIEEALSTLVPNPVEVAGAAEAAQIFEPPAEDALHAVASVPEEAVTVAETTTVVETAQEAPSAPIPVIAASVAVARPTPSPEPLVETVRPSSGRRVEIADDPQGRRFESVAEAVEAARARRAHPHLSWHVPRGVPEDYRAGGIAWTGGDHGRCN